MSDVVESQVPVLEEADAKSVEKAVEASGEKEAGQNEEVLLKSKEEKAVEPEKEVPPSFFVEETDRIKVELDVLYNKSTGRLASVSRAGLVDLSEFKVLGHTVEWFSFTPVSYEEMGNYRQRCSTFRKEVGRMLPDPVQLRTYFLAWHLKDWSIRGRDGQKLQLTFNGEGALDEKSLKLVYAASPVMVDVALTLFEKDMMM
jgi:hypothetical protein